MQEDKNPCKDIFQSSINSKSAGFLSGTLFRLNSASVLPVFCLCPLLKEKKVVVVLFSLDRKMNTFQGILSKPERESMEKKCLTAEKEGATCLNVTTVTRNTQLCQSKIAETAGFVIIYLSMAHKTYVHGFI